MNVSERHHENINWSISALTSSKRLIACFILGLGSLNSFMTEAVIINHSIDLLRKSMDWFLYDNELRHERVKSNSIYKN